MDLLAIGLGIWASVLGKEPEAPRWVRSLPWLLAAGFVASFVGTLAGLRAAFERVEHVAPAQKAELLSRGIARAMSFTAAGLVLDLVVAVVLFVVTVKLRRGRR